MGRASVARVCGRQGGRLLDCRRPALLFRTSLGIMERAIRAACRVRSASAEGSLSENGLVPFVEGKSVVASGGLEAAAILVETFLGKGGSRDPAEVRSEP